MSEVVKDDTADTHVGDTVLADPVALKDGLAWAATEPDHLVELDRHARRRDRWRWAMVIVLVCAAVLSVGVLFMMGYRAQPAPAPSVPSVKNSTPPPPITVPPPLTPDERFLDLIRHVEGIHIDDPKAVIRDGHLMCDDMTTYGDTISSMTTGIVNATPGGPNLQQERAIVMAAVTVYCPQFTYRG